MLVVRNLRLKVDILLGYYATFRGLQFSRVFFLDVSIFEYEENKLSRNFGIQLPTETAP